MDMKNTVKDKSATLTTAGLIVMLLSLTQLVPSLKLAGYSVILGVPLFFIAEALAKRPKEQSYLRFKSFGTDIRKPGVIIWVLLPAVTAIASLLLGDLIFKGGFSAHVLGRTDGMLSFENLPMLVFQLFILALGEEIAWRGFFLGSAMRKLPFWVCAAVSSALFAMGHVASGNTALVLYDIAWVFIDSMVFCVVFKKSGNCLISTVSHILGNAVGLILTFM